MARIVALMALLAVFATMFGMTAFATYENPPDIVSGGIYYIRNKWSGLYLDVYNGDSNSGTNVIQFTWNGADNQKWKIIQISPGNYVIRPLHAQDMALDVANNYDANGSNVDIWYAGTSNTTSLPDYLQWRLIKSSDGGFIIQSKCSNYNKCMVVEYASQDAGGNVIQYAFEDNAGTNDIWVLEPVGYLTSVISTSWTHSSQSSNPTGSQERLFVPYRGTLYLDFFNSPTKVVKSTMSVMFNNRNIAEILSIKNSKGYNFDIDVTSHRNIEPYKSELSAYAVVTNLPNPKIDIEDDFTFPGVGQDWDNNNEESEVVVQSPEYLTAEKDYFMLTYWLDRRNGETTDAGYIEATQEMSKYEFYGEYNPMIDPIYTKSLSYGSQGGYK